MVGACRVDTTVVPGRTEVQLAVDAGVQASELRQLAADLLNAADKLDEANALLLT